MEKTSEMIEEILKRLDAIEAGQRELHRLLLSAPVPRRGEGDAAISQTLGEIAYVSWNEKNGFWRGDYWQDAELTGASPDAFFTCSRGETLNEALTRARTAWPDATLRWPVEKYDDIWSGLDWCDDEKEPD